MSWFEIVEQELIQWLQDYEGERFHAILADPPYALISVTKRFGKEDSAPAQEGADGRFSRLSGGFMGAKWDSFESLDHYREWIKTWAELLIEKALYPGAVCLFFGGTRTFYHLAVGLEQGGFEIYDTLMFLYGAGFPKSHSISKQIDKMAGAERTEVEGVKPGHEQFVGRKTSGDTKFKDGMAGFDRPWMNDELARQKYHLKLKPATTEAELWNGYGTSLKPSFEPIIMCRAPRKGQTFASLALEYGSGTLAIDQSRIEGTKSSVPLPKFNSPTGRIYGFKTGEGRTGEMSDNTKGRWPANLLLSHHENCQKIGEIEVEGRVINRWQTGMKPFGDGAGDEYESEQLPPEIVERWACVPECPIRQLDDQAGILISGKGPVIKRETSRGHLGTTYGSENREAGTPMIWHGGSGGPSRFFYCGKASRREKDKGLENFYWKRTGKGFERVDQETWAKLERRERAKGCIHPTVKPLDICRYLTTLILPPKQDDRTRRILIPFSGSGSEIIAAKQAGWDFIVGIEMNEMYNDIARARIDATLGMF